MSFFYTARELDVLSFGIFFSSQEEASKHMSQKWVKNQWNQWKKHDQDWLAHKWRQHLFPLDLKNLKKNQEKKCLKKESHPFEISGYVRLLILGRNKNNFLEIFCRGIERKDRIDHRRKKKRTNGGFFFFFFLYLSELFIF